MPVLPGLTDAPAALERLVKRSAEAGATHFAAQVLFLRDSALRGFLPRLKQEFPELERRYRLEYARTAYASRSTQDRVRNLVASLKAKYGIGSGRSGKADPTARQPAPMAERTPGSPT